MSGNQARFVCRRATTLQHRAYGAQVAESLVVTDQGCCSQLRLPTGSNLALAETCKASTTTSTRSLGMMLGCFVMGTANAASIYGLTRVNEHGSFSCMCSSPCPSKGDASATQGSSTSTSETGDASSSSVPRLVVFGGRGFVGSHILQEALSQGLAVTSVSRSGGAGGFGASWGELDVLM
jgi:hypothetical protein